MSLTPEEVFEGYQRANSGNGQQRIPDHIRNAQRHRLYQGYNREGNYANTARNRPTTVTRPTTQETSFSEAARERNPGLRQRVTAPQPPTQSEHYENVRRVLEARQGDTRINIPESFETSPLLPGAASGGIASATGGASTLATAGGLVGAALGAGALTTSIANRYQNKGLVLPGTDYVGPGNKINIDAPRSGSDAIAKEHDIGYERIQALAARGDLTEREFAEHIEQLDTDAIRKFAEHFHTSGEWQSFVGRWGLYLKNRIEAVTGPLYPSFAGKTWVVVGGTFTRKINRIGIRLTNPDGDTRSSSII